MTRDRQQKLADIGRRGTDGSNELVWCVRRRAGFGHVSANTQ
jgi:hypothetical protein